MVYMLSNTRPGVMAQAYNPSYSGDRDQEESGSRLALAKNLQDSVSTNSWA
jgi:hypothetical protein